MMRVKICSGVAIVSASCCCARGLHFSGRNWTQAHRRWIESLTWTHAPERVVVDDYLLAIDHLEARLIELDARLTDLAQTDPYREPVGWLRCFGASTR